MRGKNDVRDILIRDFGEGGDEKIYAQYDDSGLRFPASCGTKLIPYT